MVDLKRIVEEAISEVAGPLKNVLLIHPDLTRTDFSHELFPLIYDALERLGLERLDTLNAAGTHPAIREEGVMKKFGIKREDYPLLGDCHDHNFRDEKAFMKVGVIPASFVREKTGLDQELPIYVNKLISDDYDLIIAISGTSPHEAAGFAGGNKIFFPGIADPDVIGLLHWAAVLVGIPEIIGKVENPARDVIDAGARLVFDAVHTPMLSLDMVFDETEDHRIVPRGLFSGLGCRGFIEAYRRAAHLSSTIHIITVGQPVRQAVQVIGKEYPRIWEAGKGSYKLQLPGVMADGGEVIIYAPHIVSFHDDEEMERAIMQIGYHCKEYVLDYMARHPGFDQNVASHVINVRGDGTYRDGVELCRMKVTLATGIPEEVCAKVGLGYRDPASIKKTGFSGLWIESGGKYLYRRG